MKTKTEALQTSLTQALRRLEEALKAKPTDLHKDASIQRFEFTFELSWKLMQSILQNNSIEAYGVKSIIRESARMKLIDDPTIWFKYLEARNKTTHTYQEETANKIYQEIQSFPPIVKDFLSTL